MGVALAVDFLVVVDDYIQGNLGGVLVHEPVPLAGVFFDDFEFLEVESSRLVENAVHDLAFSHIVQDAPQGKIAEFRAVIFADHQPEADAENCNIHAVGKGVVIMGAKAQQVADGLGVRQGKIDEVAGDALGPGDVGAAPGVIKHVPDDVFGAGVHHR